MNYILNILNFKEKIKKIENNFNRREKELQMLIKNDQHNESNNINFSLNESNLNEKSQNLELRKFYEAQLDAKNKEIKKFKTEFDSILQLLYTL